MKQKILDLLLTRPFVPFRIELSSGTVHTIRHPDQVMVVGALIFVGVSQENAPGPEYADVAIISLLHVAKVDILQPVATSGN